MSSRAKSKAKLKAKPRSVGRPPGATGDTTRGEILDAALAAFASAGFNAMSVRELTRQLGVSHNLVHHHFGSKEDLWRAAIDHGVGASASEWTEVLRQSAGSPGSSDVLAQVLKSAMALLTKRPEVARIVTDESARPGPRLDYLYERYVGPMVEVLSDFLRESRAFGVRDVDSRAAALFVLSAVSAQFTHDALADKLGLGSPTDYAGSVVELVLGGLVRSDEAAEADS